MRSCTALPIPSSDTRAPVDTEVAITRSAHPTGRHTTVRHPGGFAPLLFATRTAAFSTHLRRHRRCGCDIVWHKPPQRHHRCFHLHAAGTHLQAPMRWLSVLATGGRRGGTGPGACMPRAAEGRRTCGCGSPAAPLALPVAASLDGAGNRGMLMWRPPPTITASSTADTSAGACVHRRRTCTSSPVAIPEPSHAERSTQHAGRSRLSKPNGQSRVSTCPTAQHSSRIGVTACSVAGAGMVSAGSTGIFPAAAEPGMHAAGSTSTATAAAAFFLPFPDAPEPLDEPDASCRGASASSRATPGGCHSRAATSPTTSPSQHPHTP